MSEKFNLQKLLETWKSGQYKQSTTFFYLLIYLILSAVGKAFPSSGGAATQSVWTTLTAAVVGLIVGYFVLGYLWSANGGDSGRQFMDKVLSIGTVYSITRLIPVFLLLAIPYMFVVFLMPTFVVVGTAIFGIGVLVAVVYYVTRLKAMLDDIRSAELSHPATEGMM